MSAKPSKRRRIEPATKQSKLHHFFATPAAQKSAESVISNGTTQKRELGGTQYDKTWSSQSLGTAPRCRNMIPIIQPEFSSVNSSSSNVARKDCIRQEKESKFITEDGLNDEFSLFGDISLEQRSEVSSSIKGIIGAKVHTKVMSPPFDRDQSYLESYDINTVPFSAQVGYSSDLNKADPKLKTVGKLKDPVPETLYSCDINTEPHSMVVGKRITKPSDSGKEEESFLESCDLLTLPHSPVIIGTNHDTGDNELHSCDINTVPLSPEIKTRSVGIKLPSNDTKTPSMMSDKKLPSNNDVTLESSPGVTKQEDGRCIIAANGDVGDGRNVHRSDETQAIVDDIWGMFESSDEDENCDEEVKLSTSRNEGSLNQTPMRNRDLSLDSQLESSDVDESLSLGTLPILRGPNSVFQE